MKLKPKANSFKSNKRVYTFAEKAMILQKFEQQKNPSTPSVIYLKEFSCPMVCSTSGKKLKQLSVNVFDFQKLFKVFGGKENICNY